MLKPPSRNALAAAILSLFVLIPGPVVADQDSDAWRSITQVAQISGDPEKPRRHFRVKNTARLSIEEASRIYGEMIDDIYLAYGAGQSDFSPPYRDWGLYNTAPYRSATHGARYVNNYANEVAKDYGRYEEAGIFPVGSVLAKDSFSVTKDGVVDIGPLFLMEKMPAGFNRVSGDWRYVMIMADGRLFGETNGRGAQKVEYCVGCHLAKEDQDHLFFVPEEVRLP
ncbi:cytochrome P460 family protein [Pelagibius sp. Alg239-R121]|uniref:cytochrome P460 family protein n=1 Tax=Pelagibius sp. Alg239-R121 TaxID=2993448 RepID=UPI0024A70AEF|nr:cytochrome P460 family protein [Pelagibius sp. Alg239-R121]